MNKFIGLYRDSQLHNNPNGTWQNAKNIVKHNGTIKNEDGFKELITIEGLQIGSIVTNKETVIFSKHKNFDEIGIKKKFNEDWIYTPVLRGDLGFNLNCPIEGIFVYNYKEELIVVWSDGIKINSGVPKILNLTKLPFEVDANYFPVDINDLNKIKLFPNVNQGRIDINNVEGGDIGGNVVYITYCYVFEDNTSSMWFPISDIGYGASGYDPTTRNGFNLKFYNLDEQFNKIKIGLVLKEDGQLKAYESYIIEYNKDEDPSDLDLFYSLTSISNFITIGVEELVIAKDIFQKIRTITKQNNEVLIGNTRKKDFINLQKYFNNLILKPIITQSVDKTDKYLYTGFSPDEVYSIWCEVQWLDGSYSDAFHIPGRAAEFGEDVELDNSLRAEYNLQDAPEDARSFHYINTGEIDPLNTGALDGEFGFWRNEEKYPDKPEFDSSDIGGEDLRGKYIRYHRFPGLDNLYSKVWAREFLPQRVDVDELDNDTHTLKFGLKVVNFNTILPPEIQSQIQGYRLSFIKRTFADSLVVGHSLLFSASTVKRKDIPNPDNVLPFDIDTIHPFALNHLGEGAQGGAASDYTEFNGYSYGGLYSVEIFKNKPRTTITHVKANYIAGIVDEWYYPSLSSWLLYNNIHKIHPTAITNQGKFAITDEQLKYLPSNNFAAGTAFQEESNRIKFKRNKWSFFSPDSSIDNYNWYAPVVTLYQLKYNLYPGFKSTNLVVLGRTDKINESNIDFYGGDVFNSSSIDLSIYSTTSINDDNIRADQQRLRFKGLYESINEQQLTNLETPYSNLIDKNKALEIEWSEMPNRSYEISFKGEEDLSSLNDITTIQTWNVNLDFINRFPFRVNRGNKIPSENITTNALRSFLVSNYYDMPNDKGEIIALRGSNKVLYIQQEFALFAASVKDTLKGQGSEDVYLGRGDIFDREPLEIIPDDKGYIGSTSQFACIIFKGGLVTIDSLKGKIFIISQGVNEVSALGMRDYFYENSQIGLDIFEYKEDGITKVAPDNPYLSVGYITSYDEEYNRLIITKRKYILNKEADTRLYTSDGQFFTLIETGELIDFTNDLFFINKSKTFSLELKEQGIWTCEHDYFPNNLYYNNEGLFSVINNLNLYTSKIFKHNDETVKGLYYNNKFESYVDLIFNTENQVSKIYKSLQWITEVINQQGKQLRNKTISSIVVYNYDQCTGKIDLENKQFELIRDSQYTWKFNKIRDIVIDKNSPIINENGDIIETNLDNNKSFFEKRNFISKFVVVRLIIDNIDNNDVYIHSVNINSIKIG